MIEIKDISGQVRFSTPINKGAKGKFTLMKEDYIILPFSVPSPIPFKLGDYVDLAGVLDDSMGGKLAKIYEIVDLQKPTYNSSTGGYDYELRLDAYYWKWKNKIFKYTPEQAGSEASWSLTAALDVQLGVFLRNLKALGYTYRGTDFTFSIDDTVENKAVAMTYDNMNLLDALFSMAGEDKWNCDCWITDNVIHFGRNEFGDAVKIERGVEASAITRSESQGTYATRIYAFGSTRNIPTNYRPTDEQAVINGVVQKRLMLPADTPYIDAYEGMSQEEAIEDVVVFDDVYPRRTGTLSDVHTRTEEVENEDGTTETVTYYRYKDTGLEFKEEYIIEGQELQITFQSGKLNGMVFGVIFNPTPKDETRGEQLWEIVRNEDYGRPLPDDTICPADGDQYILSGFDIQLVSDQYIPAAEQELKEKALKYAEIAKKDDGTYPTTLMSDWVHEDPISRTFEFGQRINLVDDTYFENGRISRVLGWEMNLDIPWDSPVYTIGESMPYSRIGEIEDKVDALTYKGQTYTGGGGSLGYVIKTNDSTSPSDSNVFSALRSMAMFLRKDQEDETNYLIKFLGGILVKGLARFGDFVTGVSGGMIDDGELEMESGYFRKRLFVPELAFNRITYFKGRAVLSPGGGCKVKSYVKNDDGSFTVTPDLTDADALSQFKDDILSAYFTTKNEEGALTGFEQMQFRVTEADYSAKTFKMVNKPGQSFEPGEEMILAQTGNFSDEDRQTYILFDTVNGNNCITFFDHANTWDPEPAQMPAWFGKKKGMTVGGINCDNYSAVLQNILLTGLIFQIDEITGDSIRVPIDKGEWKEKTKYGYYDRVSHNGALWLCVSEETTEEEPGTGNAWLKQVAEGQKGDPGLSVVGGGHWESSKTPYEASTLVSMFNCVFMSNVRTSNPPLSIMKFKDGSYARTKLGYILAGRSADFAVHPDWTMLLDGRKLKGTSITFLGSFATVPSNPVEGNSYYNTTDKCTYTYQNGQWMLMVSDGKDGRDYEYIYTRNNSIGITPDKPDSKQQDDYVPEGWTDDYLGVSETFQVEWGCKRTKRDGVWSEWSEPAIVHRWSKDGENAVIADLDNEMVSCALTADGKVTLQQSWTTNVTMWYGYEELELTALTTSQPSGLTVQSDKSSGAVTVTATAGVSLAETNNVIITLSASKNGQNFERQLTFTIAGVRAGADGADAVIYNLVTSASSVTKYKDGTYSVTSISCTRWKSAGSNLSATQDGELKYSLDGGAEQTVNNGQSISSSSFSKSVKFLFYVDGNLVDVETIPMLAEAKDGESAVSATITNEMVNCALTADGKVSKDQAWTTQVTLWYGTEKLPLASITASQPSGMTVQTDKSAGTVTASVKKDVSMSETTDITIILTASRDGQDFQRQMTFTIAGVRAGADGSDGADAVLYSLVPSVSSVAKYKDGTYSASTVSCKRQKAVGDSIADTTDGELKYSRDGGVETNYTDGTEIATTSFTRSIKFLFYVGGKLVDVETIPMLSDGADGHDGQDGSSIEAVGHWEASQVPYAVNKLVNFGRGTFVALEETSEPPLPIARFKDGTYMRKKDGGYILAGRSADMTVNPSWRMISWSDEAETLYWLDCPISAFSYTSTGSPSPSSVEVTCKMSRGGSVSDCVTLWLAARRYNGSWVAHVGATQSSKISVPATAGYTQFVVRAYKSSSDASAWNSNYVAERGIGVAQAGKDGTDYEYIFQRTTTNSCPSTPATAQQDDYVPSGWTPDPQGVSETYPYEWASMRTKNDGTWGAFCTPYAYGVKGDIGNTGATGAFPYDRGVFKSGQSYVWNAERRDKVIHLIGGVYYNFLVKNYGATVTAAPTSASGDSNWEAMQKFESIVTDTFFADGANIGGFMFKLKGYTSDGIPYGELRSQQADGNGTPNFYVDTQTGKVYACVAEIKGTIEASSGKIGGLQISGNSLTNINGNNDAGIYLRNSTEGTFAAMGGNVVPAVGAFTMIADFENTKRYDLTDISSINYGLKLLAQNANTNIALTIDGGCVQGFAMRNTIVNTDITSKTLTRNDYNVICNNTNECTITLPSMQLYDDGHVVRIKRLNGNVLVKTSYCYVIDPETLTLKYVRPIIIYSDSQAVTGNSSNNLTMNTKGDGTELVWVRGYIGTVNGTTYYGAWIANKISYM